SAFACSPSLPASATTTNSGSQAATSSPTPHNRGITHLVVRASVETPFCSTAARTVCTITGRFRHSRGSLQACRGRSCRAEQVEQHERVVAGQRGGLAALTVVADGDGVPFGPQALLDEARRCPLVLDDQDAHFKPPLMRRRGRIRR